MQKCHSNPQPDGGLVINDFRLVRITDPNACGQVGFTQRLFIEYAICWWQLNDNSTEEKRLFALNLPNDNNNKIQILKGKFKKTTR